MLYVAMVVVSMALLCFITELNFDFIVKITAIDKVGDGKIGVVEQVVEVG